jgi:hypothetical protein
MVKAIDGLGKLLSSKKPMTPAEFEKKLAKFGDAMKDFDNFDQATNRNGIGASTIFAMFDMLVRLSSDGSSGSASVLTLKSTMNGRAVEKVFLAGDGE